MFADLRIKEKTPELNEIHTDGGYACENNDKKFEEFGITQITTAVRGRKSKIEKNIKQTEQSPENYSVVCPHQKIISVPIKKRHKTHFDFNICKDCPLR